jgi:hypothetical protein
MRMQQAELAGNAPVESSLRLRKAVGWIGALSPFAVYIGNRWVHPNHHPLSPDSMSGYYYTHMRDCS